MFLTYAYIYRSNVCLFQYIIPVNIHLLFLVFCCCQVTKSWLTLCGPMDCSTPCFPVSHQLLEFAQVHVHLIGDTIQPSHPLPPSSSFAFNPSQHQDLFQFLPLIFEKIVKGKSISRDRLFVTPWPIQSMEFSRPEYKSRQPFPSPGDLPNPGIEPRSPASQADSLPAES